MWIKLLLCGLLIAFCVTLGWLAADKYRVRMRFYSQFASFNERFLEELAYTRKPLSALLDPEHYRGEFAKLLEKARTHDLSGIRFSFLSKEETEEVRDYFMTLGRGDAVSQNAYFSARSKMLADRKEASAREAKTRGDLYLKLGLLAGLAFVILIV